MDLDATAIDLDWVDVIVSAGKPMLRDPGPGQAAATGPQPWRGLNLVNSYADHLPVSVREHVQNWRDGCIEVASPSEITFESFVSSSSPSSSSSSTSSTSSSSWRCTIARKASEPGQILGWLLIHDADMLLVNAATVLSDSMLRLGHTTKTNTTAHAGTRHFAGHFGEGVKVEINRLINTKSVVVYLTGSETWRFSHGGKDGRELGVETVGFASHADNLTALAPTIALLTHFKRLATDRVMLSVLQGCNVISISNVCEAGRIQVKDYLFLHNSIGDTISALPDDQRRAKDPRPRQASELLSTRHPSGITILLNSALM
jgi:hypothetical protein